eukprot:TRINITY_DN54391_c0_g1_i1.p1 TRINITY_DN54391_c0_g1~~TRINITY_DN54391_c0_g1_i1.p1  ORF type:complete len:369 (-),score=80.91 TRINITY_DN54391_c0_g1_i1:31-1137(-)
MGAGCNVWYLLLLLFPLDVIAGKKSPVIVLAVQPDSKNGQKDFEETISSTSPSIICFNSRREACKACQDLEPEFKQVAKKLKRKYVMGTLDIDSSANEKAGVAGKYNVSSTPTLVMFQAGTPWSSLEGFQTASAIEAWVKTNGRREVEVFESQSAFDKALKARATSETTYAAIGRPQLKDLMQYAADSGVREGWGQQMRYIFFSDGGRGRPFGAIYRGVNEMVEFDPDNKNISAEVIRDFVRDNYKPAFPQATMDRLELALAQGDKGNVFVCFAPDAFDAQAKKYAGVFVKLAKKWPQLGFSYLDVRQGMAQLLNVKCEDFPSVTFKPLAEDKTSYTKSFASPKEELNEKTMNSFLKAVYANRKKAEL